MPPLPLGSQVNAGFGIRVRSIGVQASSVRAVVTDRAGTRGGATGTLGALRAEFAGTDDVPSSILADALDEEHAAVTHTIELDRIHTRPRDPATTRGPEDLPTVQVTVPAPSGPDQAHALLEVDGSGLMRWHFAETTPSSATRGSSDLLFVIPVQDVPAVSPEAEARGAGIWRKALHLVRFDWVAGKIGDAIVSAWERANRPHQLGQIRLSPLSPGSATVHPVGAEWFRGRSGGRYLMLIHGTFSSTVGGFFALLNRSGWFERIMDSYDAVLCFDHPTISVTPQVNAVELLRYLPADRPTEVDIVCHSRGGLVARQLMDAANAAAAGVPAPTVRRSVFVASPNAGTTLASPDRLDMLLSTLTNMLSLLPDIAVKGTATAVVQVVKQVAGGLLRELDGITSMDPAGESLRALNTCAAPAGAYAIASDFTPEPGVGVGRALDVAADLYFREANDLVVPTAGVATAGGFDIPADRRFRAPSSVSHSHYFADADVRDEITRILTH